MARLVRSVDFERVLLTRSRAHTPHFALHHVAGVASLPMRAATRPVHTELSTGSSHLCSTPVDESPGQLVSRALNGRVGTHWLGAVVPKRHARRAVTRTLLKRQIRAAAERHRGQLPPGLWVVRLRAPFDREAFVSASSTRLREIARVELDSAFVAVTATVPGAARPNMAGAT